MTVTAVDFVADQLRAAAPRAEWGAQGVDRAREMAGILVANGIVDLSRLSLAPATYTVHVPDHWTGGDAQYIDVPAHDEQAQGVALVYGGRQFGYLGGPGDVGPRHPTDTVLQDGTLGPGQIAWSPYGHGHVDYYVRQSGSGFAILPVWQSSSDAGFIREGLIGALSFMVQFALPLGGVNVAQLLGAQILGPALAATYPALASVIGNVAFGTVFSGGNVAQAVSMAAAGYIGGVVGGGVVSATGLDSLGKVTAAATSAAITGGNVDKAIATSLIMSGARSMDQIFTPDPAIHYTTDLPPNDVPGMLYPARELFTPNPYAMTNDPWDIGGLFLGVDPISTTPETTPTDTTLFPPAAESPPASAFAYPIPEVTTGPGNTYYGPAGTNGDSGINLQSVTAAAMAAVSLVRAFQQTGGVVQNPAAANRTVNASTGLVVTRGVNGAVEQTRPAVGVATVTSDGGLMVNNGNGTFDYVSPTGQRTTRNYTTAATNALAASGAAFGGVSTQTLMLAGGGLLALLLLSKK